MINNFKISDYLYILLIFCFGMVSCDVFSTRSPEDPLSSSHSILPATSASIVLDNLISSVNASAYYDYSLCISSKSNGQSKEFEYFASGSALGVYSGVFDDWNSIVEFRNIKSIFSSLTAESKPVFVLKNILYENISTDSVNISSEYSLLVNMNNESEEGIYLGAMYLSVYRENNGLWYINRWIDLDAKSDSNSITLSILKAKFVN